MRSERGARKLLARRWATIMAAVGALLVSSGVALIATPTSANAGDHDNRNDKVVVCKYVGKPGASALQSGQNPVEVSVSTLKNLDPPWDGSTFPFAWTDAQGQAGGGSVAVGFVGEVPSTLSSCYLQASAKAAAVPPSCTANVPSYSTAGSVGVARWEESAAPAFGTTITLTAHAAEGYAFGSSPTTTVPVTFGPAASGCTTVTTPTGPPTPPVAAEVSPPTAPAEVGAGTTIPTVVEAGLSGSVPSPDRAGVELAVVGLLLLGAAGVVRRDGRRAVA